MRLGMHMRDLWGHKVGLAIALVVAMLATTRVLYEVSLVPPRIERDSLTIASASTHVIVDTPRSTIIDLRQSTYDLTELTNRALLAGNVMASPAVLGYISKHSGVPTGAIRVSAPLTPEQPRAIADITHQPKTSDILKSPDEYRLSVRANPTVPVLDIYSEAPEEDAARRLADASVTGLREYLHDLAVDNATPKEDQVRLTQLGRASGGTVNSGAGIKVGFLVFVFVFAFACAVVLFVARVRRGWSVSGGIDRRPIGHPG
jgi:hypothetical protein